MECRYCNVNCIKVGKRKDKQKYYCKQCRKYQQDKYSYIACSRNMNNDIKLFIKEGCGMRSICRILCICMNTLLKRIALIASHIIKPQINTKGGTYEVDEIKTYIGNKKTECWIIYSIERRSRTVVDIAVGARNTENIKRVVSSILSLSPLRIYTDRLNIYPLLIPKMLHRAVRYRTNRIERKNLTFRTHIKRLSRKTICFSKKKEMLEACVKIYCWA